jgi:hypothetical protein
MTVRRFKGIARCSWIRDSLENGEGQLRNRRLACAKPPTTLAWHGIFKLTLKLAARPTLQDLTCLNIPDTPTHHNAVL